jgi:hypothetical protein
MTSRISHTSFDAINAYAQSVFWSQVLDFVEDPDDPNEPEHEECLITSRDRRQLLLLHRADIVFIHLRSLQPHALAPGQSSSGQATTIWVPHDPGVDPPDGRVHTGAPYVINKTGPALQSRKCRCALR